LEEERRKNNILVFRLEEERNERYVDMVEMGLRTLASNIDHVARLGEKRVQRTALVIFTSFVTDLERAEKCKN